MAVTLAVVWASLALALGNSLHAPDVSADRARAMALMQVHGTVIGERYVHQGDRWVYAFDIRPLVEADRALRVAVDADRGVLVSVAPVASSTDDRIGSRQGLGSTAHPAARQRFPGSDGSKRPTPLAGA